jgi:hypothetical protein
MHKGEAGLVADRVKAPEFRHVHVVLGCQPPGDIDTTCRDVQVKGRPRTSEVGPLGHGFEVVDRLGRLDLHSTHELLSPIGRREEQIGVNLDLTDLYGNCLVVTDVDDDVVTAFQLDLQQADDTVVFELFTNRPDENRAQETSRRRMT